MTSSEASEPVPQPGRQITGTVVEFDPDIGLGVVESSDERYRFHCVEIADGSRDIAVGIEVRFELLGKFGRYEAANIRP